MLKCPWCDKLWSDTTDVSCCDCGFEIDGMSYYIGDNELKSLQQIQKEVAEWSINTFGDNNSNISKETGQRCFSWNDIFGLMEELGELARTHICANQGRKGYDQTEDGKEKAKRDRIDACCDILIFLSDYAAREGIDLQVELNRTWTNIVSKRTLQNWEEHNHEPKPMEGIAAGVAKTIGVPQGPYTPVESKPLEKYGKLITIVQLDEAGRCTCDCGTKCPLGRLGMDVRCTREELLAAGITCQNPPETTSKEWIKPEPSETFEKLQRELPIHNQGKYGTSVGHSAAMALEIARALQDPNQQIYGVGGTDGTASGSCGSPPDPMTGPGGGIGPFESYVIGGDGQPEVHAGFSQPPEQSSEEIRLQILKEGNKFLKGLVESIPKITPNDKHSDSDVRLVCQKCGLTLSPMNTTGFCPSCYPRKEGQ